MNANSRTGNCAGIAALLMLCWPLTSFGADEDADALSLGAEQPPAAVASAKPAASPWRVELELAAAHLNRRFGLSSQNGHRVGIDLRYNQALDENWRLSFSDRLDYIEPTTPGIDSTRNSVREANLSWQSSAGDTKVELGRVNLRHGQALGFNPSDFFRSGATQVLTTADPIALRANRLGTWMVRASRDFANVGVSVAWAPDLGRSNAADRPFDLDLDATNGRDRVLVTASAALSKRANVQLLGWSQAGLGTGLGANFSWLAGDATVVYGEWAYANSADRPDAALPPTRRAGERFHQAALGATYTVSGALSLTLEADYNAAGLRRDDWSSLLAAGLPAAQAVVSRGLNSQELMSRRAVLVHAAYKGLLVKQLDFSGYARRNRDDRSTVAWFELRYHWPRVDGALQWQTGIGPNASEQGVLPLRRMLQLVGTWYF